ncbi:Uncharacterised protein [Candidatus Venteria ishoeyi]|uniref:Uncharacterized protein n=1 Tax=Candidatus Venteria ishoeyi TaxID=1899563 RepID=A0A1H6FFI2_9GAMM|nr:Uncharacterised protein [Candidatus Venteria ishoeyi]
MTAILKSFAETGSKVLDFKGGIWCTVSGMLAAKAIETANISITFTMLVSGMLAAKAIETLDTNSKDTNSNVSGMLAAKAIETLHLGSNTHKNRFRHAGR